MTDRITGDDEIYELLTDPEMFDQAWRMERSWCPISFDCSLDEALLRARQHCVIVRGSLEIGKTFWAYEGSDAPHFATYMTWLGNRLTIGRIHSKIMRSGVLHRLCDVLEATAYDLRFQSVSNRHLADYLAQRGYRRIDDGRDETFMGDYDLPLALRRSATPAP